MYTSFYKLAEMPFTISTDPRFLWLGDKHSEALANLNYGLVEADGYVVLTGDVGIGKTTLVNALLESIDDSILAVNLSHPSLSIMEFFRYFAKTLDGPKDLTSKVDYLFFFEDSLLKVHNEGRKVLLIIDEAHKLSGELLEEIRLLSNIEYQGIRLINIFFVGQNELKDILINPQFRALRQRITLYYDIKPLSRGETGAYIKHRLQVAGGDGNVFSADAVALVHAFSKGYPRLINTICGRSMLTGYIKEKPKIDAAIVEECSRELDFLDPTAAPRTVVSKDTAKTAEPAPPVSVPKQAAQPTASKQKKSDIKIQSPVSKTEAKPEEKITGLQQDKPEQPGDEQQWLNWPKNTGNIIAILIIVGIFGFYLIPERNGYNARLDQEKQKVAETVELPEVSSSTEEKVEKATASQNISPSPEENITEPATSQDISFSPGESDGTKESEESGPTKAEEKIDAAAETAQQESSNIVEEAGATAESSQEKPINEMATQAQEKTEVPPEPAPAPAPGPASPSAMELATAALFNRQYQTVLDLLDAEESLSEEQSEMHAVLYNKALLGKAEQLMTSFPKEAKKLLRQVVLADDSNSRPFFLLGKLHTQDKEYAQAIDAYQKAARLDPTFPDSLFNLGFLYATTGMYENAEQYFKRAVDLEPDYLGKALFNLAVIQQRLGKNEESIANLRRASKLDPTNEKVRSYLQQAEEN